MTDESRAGGRSFLHGGIGSRSWYPDGMVCHRPMEAANAETTD